MADDIHSLLLTIPQTVVNADSTTGSKDDYALPARAVIVGWQISWSATPGAGNVTLRVALHAGGPYLIIDTSTTTTSEYRMVGFGGTPLIPFPIVAAFINVNVVTNTNLTALTVELLVKIQE